MLEFWQSFFGGGGYIPHGHCYLWQTPLVWLHVTSDSLIAIAYFSIPITLIYFIRKREDLPFDWIFAMFGAFIVACGITHIFAVWTLWYPTYWISGAMKAFTALVSLSTAVLLVQLIPQALALPSPAQLALANSLLEAEIFDRKQAEKALQQAKEELEIRVEERTAQLKQQTLQLEQTLLELQQTQTKLIQSEKMSSLGQVVAGVAHEINNPINFIYGNLSPAGEYFNSLLEAIYIYEQHDPNPLPIVQEKLQSLDLDFIKEDLPKIFDSMKNGADRIRDIVKSLRNFSRLDEAEMKRADIHEGIDSTLMMLHDRLHPLPDIPGIEIIKNYGDLVKVECYPGQLNQVFLNILNNAIDAFEEDKESPLLVGDKITPKIIKISTRTLDEKWVEIGIFNNGPGMKEAVVEQIFDPFFTTKPVGKGTGLGLSIAYQIITEKHQGELQCISAPGKGTEFIIRIPSSLKLAL
jgi:signal transduction histidine kinase